MLNKVSALIGSGMNSPTEDEILNAIYAESEGIGGDDDYDDDLDIVTVEKDLPLDFNLDVSVDIESVPLEVNDYVTSIETQAKRLEQELEECDDLLGYDPHSSRPKPEGDNAMMVYDEFQELKDAAAEAGMTVEQFKEKLLRDIDEDDFNEEVMDNEYQEISELQTELEEARLEIKKLNDDLDEEVTTFLDDRVKRLQGLPLAIGDGEGNATEDGEEISKEKTEDGGETEKPQLTEGPKTNSQDEPKVEAGPVVIAPEFTDFREFIRTQLRKTDSKAEERRTQLRKMFDVQHQKEEESLLRAEEYRRDFRHEQERQADILAAKKLEEEKRVEEEIKSNEKVMEKEYEMFQANLEQLNAAYEEEKHTFELMKKSMMRELSDKRNKAAVNIQRVYKGHRTRCLMRTAIQDLAEMKELRKKEKEQIRVMEIQYEMDLKAEQEKKDKETKEQKAEEDKNREEELKQQESLERQKKEEADRIAEETRKEEEKRQKEEKEEQERIRKEEVLAKKEEEKKKKEEERREKEEEKKKKEEEKRQQKEEAKKKQEEEKRRKQEEKRIKDEEEKKKKEEEKRRKEEEKQRKKEEGEENRLMAKSKSQNESSVDKDVICDVKDLAADAEIENNKNHVDDTKGDIGDVNDSGTNSSQNTADIASSEKGDDKVMQSGTGMLHGDQQRSMDDKKASSSSPSPSSPAVPGSSGTLSPHPPQSPCPRTQDSTSATARHRGVAISNTQSSDMSGDSAVLPQDDTPSSSAGKSEEAPEETPSITAMPKAPKEPSPVELLRLSWMKHCIPWSKVSNEPWKLSQTSATKLAKRPTSAKKKASAIPEQVVLMAAHAESLRQVSSVEFEDLPGYSLSTLSQCWNLRYLTVTQCHLVCLDGLSACKHLLYIDASDNAIEFVDLKDLGSLQCLKLSHNKLGSIHGIQGCINLRWLDLGCNNIGKVAGLTPLRRLHTLNLSHNQLTTPEGLNEAVTIQDLDLSHNFLQAFSGLNKLCLLTSLNLASNNLLQPPVLKNNVLLKWLHMSENSLHSLQPLSQCWLPVLHYVDVNTNRLESLDGLENLPSLSTLDASHNQIADVEGLKPCLEPCQMLQCLDVAGNPLLDIQELEYRNLITEASPSLELLDGESVDHEGRRSNPANEDGALSTYLKQIELFQRLKEGFKSEATKNQHKPSYNAEALCSTTFHYCDTSFKMAVEHRSAHEYGDVHSPSSPSSTSPQTSKPFTNNPDTSSSITAPTSDTPVTPAINYNQEGKQSYGASKSIVDGDTTKLFTNKASTPRKSVHKEDDVDGLRINDASSTSMSKTKFDAFLAASNEQPVSRNHATSIKNSLKNYDENPNNVRNSNPSTITPSQISARGKAGHSGIDSTNRDDGSESSDSDDLVDVTKDVSDDKDKAVKTGMTSFPAGSKSSHVVPSQQPQQPVNYMSEKDKFLMALGGGGGGGGGGVGQNHMNRYDVSDDAASRRTSLRGGDGMGAAPQSSSSLSHNKNLFDSALSNKQQQPVSSALNGQSGHGQGQGHGQGHASKVKANVVGAFMDRDGSGEPGLQDMGLDDMLAETFDFDSPDFDFEKYLDIGELDEFLEKGWRPEEAPQIPSSNYPVLGKISQNSQKSQHQQHQHQQHQQPQQFTSKPFHRPTPPPPPSNPHQAWNNSNNSNHNHNTPTDSLSRQQQHIFSPSKGIPPLPNPSPSPSSVASAAETLGGGSIKSKKRDELSEEWGFKDGRTAELMMARARKMKYNSDKKKKLSKLNPQQRYQLFQKLEESGKIQHVRPRPAKVLPRKEYFQAREEEVQRQDFERVQEEKTRVNRTFEWLHTQVGDYQISSSRINPGSGPVYSNQEVPGQGLRSTNNGQTSPSSDSHHMNHHPSKMAMEDYGSTSGLSHRRYSVGDGSGTRSPLLPPITISSAPSQQHPQGRKEKMSFRTEPVELSGGWGGGKKRHGK